MFQPIDHVSVSPTDGIEPTTFGFDHHPGQSFPLSLCGPNSMCKANAHMVYGLKHLLHYILSLYKYWILSLYQYWKVDFFVIGLESIDIKVNSWHFSHSQGNVKKFFKNFFCLWSLQIGTVIKDHKFWIPLKKWSPFAHLGIVKSISLMGQSNLLEHFISMWNYCSEIWLPNQGDAFYEKS